MRIIHFSDIHVGLKPGEVSSFFDKRILGTTNYYLRRRKVFNLDRIPRAYAKVKELQPDVVICSGDLASVGAPGELGKAVELLKPFVADSSFDFWYIPGNHDAYVNNVHCRKALVDTVEALNKKQFNIDNMPWQVNYDYVNLFFVNEARPTSWLYSTGTLDEKSQQLLQSWKSSVKGTKIVVGHFPVLDANGKEISFRRKLIGGEAILQALNDGNIDVALCGHIHKSYSRQHSSGAMEICAGSLTAHGKMNMLDIDKTGEIKQNWFDI